MKESKNSEKNSKQVLVLSITPSLFADVAEKGHIIMDIPEGTNRLVFLYGRNPDDILQMMRNEKFLNHLYEAEPQQVFEAGEIPKGQVN